MINNILYLTKLIDLATKRNLVYGLQVKKKHQDINIKSKNNIVFDQTDSKNKSRRLECWI